MYMWVYITNLICERLSTLTHDVFYAAGNETEEVSKIGLLMSL